jgi:hypothetical protein
VFPGHFDLFTVLTGSVFEESFVIAPVFSTAFFCGGSAANSKHEPAMTDKRAQGTIKILFLIEPSLNSDVTR